MHSEAVVFLGVAVSSELSVKPLGAGRVNCVRSLVYEIYVMLENILLSIQIEHKLKWDDWEGAHKVSLNILSQVYVR